MDRKLWNNVKCLGSLTLDQALVWSTFCNTSPRLSKYQVVILKVTKCQGCWLSCTECGTHTFPVFAHPSICKYLVHEVLYSVYITKNERGALFHYFTQQQASENGGKITTHTWAPRLPLQTPFISGLVPCGGEGDHGPSQERVLDWQLFQFCLGALIHKMKDVLPNGDQRPWWFTWNLPSRKGDPKTFQFLHWRPKSFKLSSMEMPNFHILSEIPYIFVTLCSLKIVYIFQGLA